jgi:hypothetical protein
VIFNSYVSLPEGRVLKNHPIDFDEIH